MLPVPTKVTAKLPTIIANTDVNNHPRKDSNALPPSYKHFKLISVSFKEASLDSPSFRASMNHFDLQLLNTEKWLTALTSSLLKVPREVKELRGFLNSFLEYLVPLFLQDGLLDQEYTVASLNNTKEGLQKIWALAMGIIEVNMPNIETARDEIMERIAAYKRLRKRFDAAQEKYDQYLSLYMAVTKLKEAAMVMEELLQVFAVRKEYILLCLDLTMEISEVSNLVNERLTVLNFSLWNERMKRFSQNPLILAFFSEFWEKTKRIRCWSDNYHRAMLNLSGDLLMAKKHIEERTVELFTPSNVLNDYRTLLINSRILNDTTESSAEIQGYLFMKTWTEKSNKPIWVRRWAFIQGGVFGFLVLSPAQSSVQETDKIGVLLCNAKYSPNEDRRLCFEVKTIDTTLTLQAETLTELKSWLKVFENARNRIISEDDPMHDLLTIAGGRYPPLVTEFLSSINTLVDKDITSSRIVNSAGQIITSSKLSAHLEKNAKIFQSYIFNQIARIYLPVVTDTSRSSLIAYSLTGSTAVPTALSANIWGSLNWGVYYMNDEDQFEEVFDDDIPDEKFTKQIGNGIKVPRNYPNLWLTQEIQLRALFESAVGPLECCLVSFNCLLSPNANQELRGSMFFTQKNLYSYIHSLGFVSLGKASITRLVEAQCTAKQNYDLLKVVNIQGLVRAKLFLDDGMLVAKKLNCIFKNAASDLPAGVSEIIDRILQIEDDHKAEVERRKNHIYTHNDPGTAITNPTSFDFMIPSDPDMSRLYQVNFSDEMTFVGEHIVKLPPKALFHMLYGSRSTLFEESYPVVNVKLSNHTKWLRHPDPNKALYREFVTDFYYYGSKSGRIVVRQEIETMAENEYYNCNTTRSKFKLHHGPEFWFFARIVLIGIEGGHTKLKYYNTMTTDKTSPFSWMVVQICRSYTQSFFGSICRQIDDATASMGHSGKILKAIYTYGKIEVTEVPYKIPDVPPSEIGLGTVIRLFYMGAMTSAARRFFVSVYFVASAIRTLTLSLSMHRVLVGLVAMLTLLNLYLGSITTQYYWNLQAAKSLVRDVITYEPKVMERAIYIKDIHEMLRKQTLSSDSMCFRTFENHLFVLNFADPAAWNRAYKDDLTRGAALKLRRSLQDIGIRRNELLMNLRMLNALEEEIARGEWKNWLVGELEKCEHIKRLPLLEQAEVHNAEFEAGINMINNFCISCEAELDWFISLGQI